MLIKFNLLFLLIFIIIIFCCCCYSLVSGVSAPVDANPLDQFTSHMVLHLSDDDDDTDDDEDKVCVIFPV